MAGNFSIMLWNRKGAASSSFFCYYKQYLDVSHSNMLVIMETRIHPSRLENTFRLQGFDGFTFSEGRGLLSGIVVAWKSTAVQVLVVDTKFQYIHMQIGFGSLKQSYFTVVYASSVEDTRCDLWTDLRGVAFYGSIMAHCRRFEQ